MDTSILLRLGLVLSGTNVELVPAPMEQKKEEPKEGTGKDKSEPKDDEDKDESDEDADGGGSDSDDSDEDDDSDDSDEDDGSSGDEDSDEDESDEDEGGSSGDDGEEDESDEEDNDGSSGEEDESDEDESDEDDGDSDEDDSDEDDDDSDDPGSDDEDGDAKPTEDEAKPTEDRKAGGHSETDGDSLVDLAQALLGGESELKDLSKALAEALGEENSNEELKKDEQVWRPYDPSLDTVRVVPAGDEATKTAQNMMKKISGEVSFLRNQLRSKFLQARAPHTIHGVRKGSALSERRLVDSVVELRAGRRPTRPDWTKVEKPECSLACAVVIDESGSMSGDRLAAGLAALTIASSLESLGSPCLVVGPRNGQYNYGGSMYNDPGYRDGENKPNFHRDSGTIIDVFKDWEEPMTRCVGRFAKVQATGGTPLEDGIQYALQALNTRKERHRVVLVITDGCPDNPDVTRYQIRVAGEAGVQIVGVGISYACKQVEDLFPLNVLVPEVKELPVKLLGILSGIMFPKAGRAIQLDAKYATSANGTRIGA